MVKGVSAEWCNIAFSELLKQSDETIEVDPTQNYQQITVRMWGNGVVSRGWVTGDELGSSRWYVAHQGQFILSKIDARHGAFGLVPPELEGAIVSNDFPLFDIDASKAVPEYLYWLSRTHDFVDLCKRASEGTTNRVRLKLDRFLAAEIPLPPIDEQRRIVAHIDAIAKQIAAARGLRQGAVEEAEALLNAVKNDVFSDEYVASFPLILLGDVSDIRSGVTLGRKLVGDTISLPYLRVANVQDGYLDLDEVKEVEVLASEFDKWQLQFGDILLTEGGDWDKLGRGTVWQDEIPNCIHQNHIFRVRVDLELFNPHFLMALISSPRGKRYFQDASKQTTNLASINQRQLKAFQVVCPPLTEQRLIVQEIEEVGRQATYFKRLQADSAAELDALLPSLLDQAFRGEL
jgi:type I restriction enzyme S subunit